MSVGITGHTKGIGAGLYQAFAARGETVHGYSRTNGYDITSPGATDRILDHLMLNGGHTLILNAQSGFMQTHQLYAALKFWREDPEKTIIAISSNASDDIKRNAWPYSVQKLALDAAMDQMHLSSKCRLINIKPGVVDTDFARLLPDYIKRISVDDVVRVVLFAYDQPREMLIKSITVQPRLNI
jgi:NADP-dependent 3-hydroxy acid dehydrogenase YdfG